MGQKAIDRDRITGRLMRKSRIPHSCHPLELPFLLWQGWQIGPTGLIAATEHREPGKIYTPDILRLLEWQADFYRRGKMNLSNFYPDYPGTRPR